MLRRADTILWTRFLPDDEISAIPPPLLSLS
jgi:hypothetical protein